MTKKYQRLTLEQRYLIQGMLASKCSKKKIADEIGVHYSTIYREIKRNTIRTTGEYSAKKSQEKARRRVLSKRRYKYDQSVWDEITKLIKKGWSPGLIYGRFKRENKPVPSVEYIYQYIYKTKGRRESLIPYLARKKKKRGGRRDGRGGNLIKGAESIHERPEIVGKRSRVGDWELDTIIGKSCRGAIVTLVERKTRYCVAALLPSKNAEDVKNKICALLLPHLNRLHTITCDNGTEFTEHKAIAEKLKSVVYFCDPRSPWQKGSVEQLNGLIRRYFPKGTDFLALTDKEVQEVVNRLNHRPRAVLGFLSPYEVYYKGENVVI